MDIGRVYGRTGLDRRQAIDWLIFDLEQRWQEGGGLANEKPASLDEKLEKQRGGRRRGKQQQQQQPTPVFPSYKPDLYLSEPLIDIPGHKSDPIGWWRDIGSERFPRFSYMATDFLTIPSSTAATERQFCSCGLITPSRLRRSVISVSQGLERGRYL
jgi:hypothetical protein